MFIPDHSQLIMGYSQLNNLCSIIGIHEIPATCHPTCEPLWPYDSCNLAELHIPVDLSRLVLHLCVFSRTQEQVIVLLVNTNPIRLLIISLPYI